MRKRVALAGLAVWLVAGCGFIGDSFGGNTVYPSAGPVPQAGTVWESLDGTAGLRLRADGKADVWGLPWYEGGPMECDSRELEWVTETVVMEVHADVHSSLFKLIRQSEGQYGYLPSETQNLSRSDHFPGWSVLTYTSCHLFNDGHDPEFHMVEP